MLVFLIVGRICELLLCMFSLVLCIVYLSDRLIGVVGYLFFFFFKQKTAYEMRISDWSSDVCSSDLRTDRSPFRPSENQDRLDRRSILGSVGRLVDFGKGKFADQTVEGEFPVSIPADHSRDELFGVGIALGYIFDRRADRKCTRLNSCHYCAYRMPYSA